jgi:hypothetical protein
MYQDWIETFDKAVNKGKEQSFEEMSITEFEEEIDKFLRKYTPNQLIEMLKECSKIDSKDKLK